MTHPDIFTNVHKGIRHALFAACSALGRAGDDVERGSAARDLLRDALRFVSHHGENEDLLLIPLLSERAPQVTERMRRAHEKVEVVIAALDATLTTAPTHALYGQACALTALYLDHMREEEVELEREIRAALSAEEIAAFGRGSVERTAPDDQRMMLAFMLPAMTQRDVDGFLARLPPALAASLRPLSLDVVQPAPDRR